MINFIKIFMNSLEAETFAKEVKGTIIIRYDWDEITNKMIKEFVVKY